MPLFSFALEDWYRHQLGGQYELYVRPDRPYTVIFDNERNLIAISQEKASNSNWYAEEFMKLLAAGKTLSLNQSNIYLLELEALLSEVGDSNFHSHFIESFDQLSTSYFRYTSFFQVNWIDVTGETQFGYLGIRSRSEYLLVINAIKYLSWPEASFEYQKARNIIASLTGVIATEVFEVSDTIPIGI